MFNYSKLNENQVEYVAIGPVTDIENGDRLFLEIDNLAIVVFNIGEQIFAIGDVCSHDDGPLGDGDIVDHEITCPRHGATFDVRTGKVLTLPAVVDIPSYPVRIVDGQIEIGIPV
jgi:3-phenylpropionate/trans-cinnamate dioxygenase ferredoxin component